MVEEGAAGYGARGRYDPSKLWIPLFSFVLLLFLPGQGRRSTRARGRLSEAKTQRRPTARERESEKGGDSFVVLLFLYLSFEQGKQRHVEEKMLAKMGDGYKAEVV